MTILFQAPVFTTREEYVQWRQEWRDSYRALSVHIRTHKHVLKQALREDNYKQELTARSELFKAKQLANDALELRAQSKVLAQQAYVARKQALVAA